MIDPTAELPFSCTSSGGDCRPQKDLFFLCVPKLHLGGFRFREGTYPATADNHVGIIRVKLDAEHAAAVARTSCHPGLELHQQLL